MPYISTERVKEIRQQIKKEFPKPWKFSIVRDNHSSVNVSILEGPFEMCTHRAWSNRHEGVNHFYIKDNYKNHPEVRDVLLKLKEIMSEGQKELVYDGDYGSVPNFYIRIEIGRWDKPYKVV